MNESLFTLIDNHMAINVSPLVKRGANLMNIAPFINKRYEVLDADVFQQRASLQDLTLPAALEKFLNAMTDEEVLRPIV